MARSMDAGILAELSKGAVQIALLAELEFASATVRLWSGMGDLIYGGYTYTGVGTLGEVTPIQESGKEIRSDNLTLRMSGIPSSMLSMALAEEYQGRTVRLRLAFFTSAWVVIEAVTLFVGRMDVMQIDEGAETSTISVSAESRLADLQRPRVRRYTHEDQLVLYPEDLGLEFASGMANAEIVWGPGSTPAADSIPLGLPR